MTRQDEDDKQSPSSREGSTGETTDERSATDEETNSNTGSKEDIDSIAEKPDESVEQALEEVIESTDVPTDATDVDSDESGDVSERLVDRVENRPAAEVAGVIESLRAERQQLEAELEASRERADDFESRLKRKQADFQNYKKRQKERMEEEKQRATEDLVERLLDVRDNLARALEQDESADIRSGVESTLSQFDDELDRENVSVIEPAPGDEVDPQRHEVLIRIDSDQPSDSVAELHRYGYEMGGKVLRPAQVAVSDGPPEGERAEQTDPE